MKLSKTHLKGAVEEGILTSSQADDLCQYLSQQPDSGPAFSFTNILYYLGGFIAISAMTLFMTLGWEAFGGWGIFAISVTYALLGYRLAAMFESKALAIPAGISATFVVSITPLAIYGLLVALGFWDEELVYREYHRYIEWQWFSLEVGTLLVGLAIFWRYRYPFLLMPIAITLWYMSMDLAMIWIEDDYDFAFRAKFSMFFGLLMLLFAIWVDFKSQHKADYAFWLYIFGVLAFWGGMTAQDSDSELAKFIYCLVNLLMIGVGIVLMRRVFVIFGGLGVCTYLGYLSWNVFEDSLLFPIALTVIGFVVIWCGVLWQRHEGRLTTKLRACLPESIRAFIESRT